LPAFKAVAHILRYGDGAEEADHRRALSLAATTGAGVRRRARWAQDLGACDMAAPYVGRTRKGGEGGTVTRQKVLVLWLQDSALDSAVVAWSLWDGTGQVRRMAGDEDAPPYRNGVQALRDGWRLFQASQLNPHYPGAETQTSYLKYEFWFESLVQVEEARRS
jgi:hypothetical protein